MIRPDPADGRDAAVRLWCNWHDQMASSKVGGGLGLGCRGEVFMVGGSWFERVVCSCLHHVEPFDMSHDHSRSLGCKYGTMQGKMMVTSPSDASATKLFQCCLSNAASISRRIPVVIT